MRNVKIAAIQMQCSTNLQDNLEKAEKMVRQAAGDGAQIILLPELFEREYFASSADMIFIIWQSLWKKTMRCRWACGWQRNSTSYCRSAFMNRI